MTSNGTPSEYGRVEAAKNRNENFRSGVLQSAARAKEKKNKRVPSTGIKRSSPAAARIVAQD
jgi:hypothetical protein